MKSVVSEWRAYHDRYTLREEGEIFSFSVVHVASQAFSDQVPYVVAVILLDSGKKITSHIVDCDISSVSIGDRVRPLFRKVYNGQKDEAISYGVKYTSV